MGVNIVVSVGVCGFGFESVLCDILLCCGMVMWFGCVMLPWRGDIIMNLCSGVECDGVIVW